MEELSFRRLRLRMEGRVLVVALIAAAILVLLVPGARAHMGSGASCQDCHTTYRNGMSVTGFQLSTNLGGGTFNVFQVRPGQTAAIGVRVTDGHNEYGLALVNLGAGGIGSVGNRLVSQADPAWTKRSSYYSLGPKSANQSWTFNLGVQPGTPPDHYLLTMRMAGTGGGRWNQSESFYVRVLPPLPPAPQINRPSLKGGIFSCEVGTAAAFTYFLECRRTLADATWTVAAQVAGDGLVKTLTDPDASGPQSIYRVRVE